MLHLYRKILRRDYAVGESSKGGLSKEDRQETPRANRVTERTRNCIPSFRGRLIKRPYKKG